MTSDAAHQYQSSLPKLLIAPNSTVYLRLDLMNPQSRPVEGELLGVQHYDFFMVKINSFPGVLNLLVPHSLIEVRFSYEGSVHHFRSELVSYITKPSLMLFIAYPTRICISELRKTQRLMCSLPVFIQAPKGDGKGIVVDISKGGCQMSFLLAGNPGLRKVQKEENVILHTNFAVNKSPVYCTARVKKVEQSMINMSIGVAFEKLEPEFMEDLNEYYEFIQELLF